MARLGAREPLFIGALAGGQVGVEQNLDAAHGRRKKNKHKDRRDSARGKVPVRRSRSISVLITAQEKQTQHNICYSIRLTELFQYMSRPTVYDLCFSYLQMNRTISVMSSIKFSVNYLSSIQKMIAEFGHRKM